MINLISTLSQKLTAEQPSSSHKASNNKASNSKPNHQNHKEEARSAQHELYTSNKTITPEQTLSQPELRERFWQRFALEELTSAEWEALCDGCGACCLVKFLEDDEHQNEVEYTDVACQLLDCQTGYCSDYAHRQQFVPDCVALTVDKLPEMMWLPRNCAYKRLYLGQELPKWHLLITQDAVATQHGMRKAGVGVAGRCISELGVDEEELEDRIVRWVKV